jgi:hypothetical protein
MKFGSSVRTTADWQGGAFARASVQQVDDKQLAQELTLNLLNGETQQKLEHIQPYGLTYVPLKPGEGGSGQDEPGEGGSANPNAVAEALVVFHANRSHGLVLPTWDRRYRLGSGEDQDSQMQPGDVALHNHQTHQIHLHDNGIHSSVPNDHSHAERVHKQGDDVKGKLAQLPGFAKKKFGQTPWLKKTPHSYKYHDKNLQQGQHPKTVNHHVITGDAILPASGQDGDPLSQLPGVVAQMQTAASGGALVAVRNLAGQASSLISQLTGGSAGASAAMMAMVPQLQGMMGQLSGITGLAGLSGMMGQLQGVMGQFSGLMGGSGLGKLFSQIKHIHSLDDLKGILHSAFQGQHTTKYTNNGIATATSGNRTTSAKAISHHGNTSIQPDLKVANNAFLGSKGWLGLSDADVKSNIAPYGSSLVAVLRLQVKSFNKQAIFYDDDHNPIISTDAPPASFGLVAQDVQAIFPDLVIADNGLLYIDNTAIAMLHLNAFVEHAEDYQRRMIAVENRAFFSFWPTVAPALSLTLSTPTVAVNFTGLVLTSAPPLVTLRRVVTPGAAALALARNSPTRAP